MKYGFFSNKRPRNVYLVLKAFGMVFIIDHLLEGDTYFKVKGMYHKLPFTSNNE